VNNWEKRKDTSIDNTELRGWRTPCSTVDWTVFRYKNTHQQLVLRSKPHGQINSRGVAGDDSHVSINPHCLTVSLFHLPPAPDTVIVSPPPSTWQCRCFTSPQHLSVSLFHLPPAPDSVVVYHLYSALLLLPSCSGLLPTVSIHYRVESWWQSATAVIPVSQPTVLLFAYNWCCLAVSNGQGQHQSSTGNHTSLWPSYTHCPLC